MFSKTCELGIKATIHIASHSKKGRKIKQKEIAEVIDSPISYAAKILKQLTEKEIIQFSKGPDGGYHIDQEKLDEVSLCCIVKAIDGESIYKGCGLGLNNCNESKPCIMHTEFKSFQSKLKNVHQTTTLNLLTNKKENALKYVRQF